MNHDRHPQHKPDISKANVCPPCPSDASLLDRVIYWLGVGLGSGLPKKAPGTWGTLAGLIMALPLMMLGLIPFMIVTILAGGIGVYICGRTSALMSVHDDPHIVWDEWVGMWIALFPITLINRGLNGVESILLEPIGIINLILAFVLFRLFDIVKPFPIGWADKRVSGGLGIMLDDIIAGVMSVMSIFVIWMVVSSAWFYLAS